MTVMTEGGFKLFADAVTTLISADRSSFDDQDWLEFTTGFEQLRNQLTAVDTTSGTRSTGPGWRSG